MNLTYKKIPESDKEQLFKLIDVVLGGLKNPAFFIPYSQWELDNMFDDVNYAPLYGAYDGDKLVGMAQLYLSQDWVADLKQELELNNYKVCELGVLVLPEYRGIGIAVKLGLLLLDLAKDLGFDYAVAKIHPENISSWKTVARGFEFVKETTLPEAGLRKLYIKRLKTK